MTDPAAVPEAPNVAETAHFLRRFANLMANGSNAAFLQHAADLLEGLTARVTASSDEEQLWRYKYETLSQQNDELEAEGESLRHDIERHVKLSSFIITERDALKATLEGRETELRELGETLKREQETLKSDREAAAAKSQAQESAIAELRAESDQERAALKASLNASITQIRQQRSEFQQERDELQAKLSQSEKAMAELRLGFDGERLGFDGEREAWRSRLTSREEELTAIQLKAQQEHEELLRRLEELEAKRAELRTAFERISQLDGAAANQRAEALDRPPAPPSRDQDSTPGQNSAVVPKETLRQARAQFEFLAKECVRRGDVATRAMCELGAHTMAQALIAEEPADSSPVGEVALSILGPVANPHPTRQ